MFAVVSKWKALQASLFPVLLYTSLPNGDVFRFTGFCAGNSPVTGELPAQRPVTRSIDGFFFICAWTNSWVNNGYASDLRRHSTHYDVIVMCVTTALDCNPFIYLYFSITPPLKIAEASHSSCGYLSKFKFRWCNSGVEPLFKEMPGRPQWYYSASVISKFK